MSRRGVAREQTSVKLEDDQLQEFKAAFQLFSGGKETLSASDLDKALKKFGIKNANAKDMLKEVDSSAEEIDFLQFANLMSRKMAETLDPVALLLPDAHFQSDPEGDVRDAFEKFDWRRTGEIGSAELGEALTNLGKPITTRELQEFLALTEASGQVHYNKFIADLYGKPAENK